MCQCKCTCRHCRSLVCLKVLSVLRDVFCVFKCLPFTGLQLDASSPIVYCYLEFKLSYLKNLKLFSMRIKELSEPIVL